VCLEFEGADNETRKEKNISKMQTKKANRGLTRDTLLSLSTNE
jgi:hypothetical protein